MTVVIDIGCYDHPDHQGASQDSIGQLIARFHPDELRGYDPHPKMPERASFDRDGTRVTLERKAVWTEEGKVPYDLRTDSPLGSTTGEGAATVRCIDISHSKFWAHERLIIKLDVEGSEYRLLRHWVHNDAISRIDRLLVEWHDLPARAEERDELLARIPCPVEEWS